MENQINRSIEDSATSRSVESRRIRERIERAYQERAELLVISAARPSDNNPDHTPVYFEELRERQHRLTADITRLEQIHAQLNMELPRNNIIIGGGALVGSMPEDTKIKPMRKLSVPSTILQFAQRKADVVKARIGVEEDEIKDMERAAKRNKLTLVKKRLTKQTLEEKYASFLNKKQSDLIKEFRETVKKVKADPLIESLRVDSKRRIIVRTAPLKVKKEAWKRARTAGQYEIRIDFSQENISKGISVLNITKRFQAHYDSPTITNTSCCWGNISGDIEMDFNTQDLYELVTDMIGYITSPYDGNGYLTDGRDRGDNKKDKGGWEKWFSDLKKCKPGYSFEKFDKSNDDLFAPIALADLRNANHTNGGTTATISNWSTTSGTMAAAPDPQGMYRLEICHKLEDLGLVSRAVYHFADIITERAFAPRSTEELGMEITNFRVIGRGGYYTLFVERNRPSLVQRDLAPSHSIPRQPRTEDEYHLNEFDFNGITLDRLRRHGSISVRANTQRLLEARELREHNSQMERSTLSRLVDDLRNHTATLDGDYRSARQANIASNRIGFHPRYMAWDSNEPMAEATAPTETERVEI